MKTINAMNLVGAETNVSAHGLAIKPLKGPTMELTKDETYLYQMWVAMAADGSSKAPLVLKTYRVILPDTLEYTKEVAEQLNSLLIVANDQPVRQEDTVTFELDGKFYMGRYDSLAFISPDKEAGVVNVVYFKETPREAMRQPAATGFWAMGIAQARLTLASLEPLFERAQLTAESLRVAKELADTLSTATTNAVDAVSPLAPLLTSPLDVTVLRTN